MSDCGCNNIDSCEEQKCGCAFELDLACVRYNGEDLDCLNFKKGDNLETFFQKFEEIFCDFSAETSNEPCVNEVTHEELIGLLNTSSLTQGCFYVVTDFQTVYDQPDFDYSGTAKTTVETKSGGVEPLALIATSVNKLGVFAKSLVFPKDVIKYDPTWVSTEVMGEPAKGRITERIDDKGNRTSFDHRTILLKRYEGPSEAVYYLEVDLDGGFNCTDFILSTQDVGNGSTSISMNNGTVTGPAYLTSNDIVSYINTHTGERSGIVASASETGTPFNVTASYSNGVLTIKGLAGSGSFENGRPLNLSLNGASSINIASSFSEGSYDDYNYTKDDGSSPQEFLTFGVNSKGNFLGDILNPNPFLVGNNVFKGAAEGNTLGVDSTDNTFEVDSLHNDLGSNTKTNKFSTSFEFNTFGDFAKNNVSGVNFKYNVIGFGFDGNSVGTDFNTNTIGKSFYGNVIKDFFSFNVIENDFYNNNIGNNFGFFGETPSINYIGNSFYNNTIDNNFHSNRVLHTFSDNLVGTSFSYNTIGANFKQNSVGTFFGSNVIEDGFNANSIGENFRYNKIGSGFFSNIIGDLFSRNTVAKGLNSLDFSFATHVYGGYDCNILGVQGGVYRLFYYDSGFFPANADPIT